MNKKQLEAYLENKKEIKILNRLKQQYEFELKPSSHSIIDLTRTPLMVHEHSHLYEFASKIMAIDKRIKQLKQLNNQVEQFINKLPKYEKELMTDLYIECLPRLKCAHKYHCDVRTLTRMVNRILIEYSPYQVVL